MNIAVETDFIKKFVKKQYQDRLLFELTSEKHRMKGISRLSHNTSSILKEECVLSNKPLELNKLLRLIDNDENECYMITWDEKDGRFYPINVAIDICMNSYMAVVLIFNHIAFIKEEVEKGSPIVYILMEKLKKLKN